MMVCGEKEGNALWLASWFFVSCLHVVTAGRYVTQNTTGDLVRYYLNDLGVEVTRHGHLVFELQACQDAFIFLDETLSHVNYYQIIIGAGGNTWCGLRDRCDSCSAETYAYGSFLNCSSYVPFWLSWDDQGKVMVGEGDNPGKNLFLTFTDTTTGFEIHYLSVSSYYDQTGSWNLLIDDSPVFISPSPDGNKTIDVSENTTVGDTILTLVATDPENDAILFDVIGEYSNIFTCIGNELKLNAALDFENTQLYRIYIRANDSRNVVEVSLNIRVTDVIDEYPVIILSQVTSVLEELPASTLIGPFFHVTDADIQDTLTYFLSGPDQDYFSINSSTGEISMKTRLNRDGSTGKTDVSVVVTTTDSAGLTASVVVAISVMDVNDNVPTFAQSVYYWNITENSTSDVLLGQLTCVDEDLGGNSNFSLLIIDGDDTGGPKFSIRGLDLFADGTSLDYESAHEYTLTVAAVDSPGDGWQNTGSTVAVIQILPANEYAPVWVNPVTNSNGDFPSHVILENTTIGSLVLTFLADDHDGGVDGDVEYHLMSVLRADGTDASDTFTLDYTSGHLTTTKSLNFDQSTGGTGYFDLVVRAADLNKTPKSVDGNLRLFISNVNDNTPYFNQSLYRFQVTCDTDLESQTFGLKVTDEDTADLHFFFIESNIYISINSSTGVLTPLARPSSECDNATVSLLLTVSVTDNGSPQETGECYVFFEFLPCSASSTSTTDSSTDTTVMSDSTTDTQPLTTVPTLQATSLTADEIEKWSLRIACGLLGAMVVLMGSAYLIGYQWCSNGTNKSVAASHIVRVSPKTKTTSSLPKMSPASRISTPKMTPASRISTPSWSIASRVNSPSWTSPGSFPERSTQMTSLPSIESLHLV